MRLRVAVIIGCGVPVAACSDSDWEHPDDGGQPCGPFTSAFELKDKFDQPADVFIVAEPIRFELRITNVGRVPAQQLGGPDHCPPVVFSVSDRVDETVWASSDGIGCIQIPAPPVTFAPGETKTLGWEWQQRVRGGSQAAEGAYTAHSETRGGRCFVNSAGFAIR